jgi:hypothetical protein
MKETLQTQNSFYHDIKSILQTARDNAYKSVNFIMVEAYWNIGKKIVEVEQNGETKAKYGSKLISELSKQLTVDFGKGFNTTNLKMMRQFYLIFPNRHTLCDQLSWSHYRLIMRIENEKARDYYIQETIASNWSVRALERQINSLYYERLISSQEKQPVIQEAKENTKNLQLTAKDIIKDPYVSKYQLYLQSEEEFKREIERDVLGIELNTKEKDVS